MDETHFTPRQRQVITEMCKGKSNKEIAKTLGMAESTVKLHLKEIFKTMGVNNRNRAILVACDFAVTEPDVLGDLTDLQILEVFTDISFTAGTTESVRWSDKVLLFGRAINKRYKENKI